MTIQKRDKKKRRAVKAAPSPEVEIKSFTSPPVDTMVRTDICKWCGRKMLEIRCQCGWVRPVNK